MSLVSGDARRQIKLLDRGSCFRSRKLVNALGPIRSRRFDLARWLSKNAAIESDFSLV